MSIVLVVGGVLLLGFLFSKVEELLSLTPKALHAVRWLDAATASNTERTVAASIIQHIWRSRLRSASENHRGVGGGDGGDVHPGCAPVLRASESARLIVAGRATRRQAVLKGMEVRDSFLDQMDQLDASMHAAKCTIRAIASYYQVALPALDSELPADDLGNVTSKLGSIEN